jgi:hypothetical protein
LFDNRLGISLRFCVRLIAMTHIRLLSPVLCANGLKDESIEGIDDRALSFCMTLNRFEILNSYESYVKLSTFWVLHLQHIHDTSDRWSKFDTLLQRHICL